MIIFNYKLPNQISDTDYLQLVELIFSGGENTKENILPKLKAAKEIAFAKNGEEIISTAAIKQPNEETRKSVFERANSEYSYLHYILEIGFWATKKEYQCKGLLKSMLYEQLTKLKDKKIYCILHNQNAIELMTTQYFFKVSGNSFLSKASGKPYNLLIKE